MRRPQAERLVQLDNYRACQKVAPLKNFANFSRTIERYDITLYTIGTKLPIQLFANVESFITLPNYTVLLVMAT